MKARLSYISPMCLAMTILLLHCSFHADAADKLRPDQALLERVFAYAQSVEGEEVKPDTTYAYTKYSLFIRKRNITLLAVPTMWAVAHGRKRHYLGENYERIETQGRVQFSP